MNAIPEICLELALETYCTPQQKNKLVKLSANIIAKYVLNRILQQSENYENLEERVNEGCTELINDYRRKLGVEQGYLEVSFNDEKINYQVTKKGKDFLEKVKNEL